MPSDLFKKEEEEIKKFTELRKKEEEEFTIKMAQKLGLPYVNLLMQSVNLDALAILNEDIARNSETAVIDKQDFTIKVAVKNPQNQKTISVLENLKKSGFKITLFLASSQGLKNAFNEYEKIIIKDDYLTGELEITPENLWKLKEQIKLIDDFKNLFARIDSKNTSVILELIIAGSLSLDSSDIHIEPEKDAARIRFRIDGILQEVTSVPKLVYKHILSRIKLLSELKINVSDTPQDGRFSISTDEKSIEIRTSVLPGPDGESIVLRILNPDKLTVSVDDLGFSDYDMEFIKSELKRSNGLILTTGPTGSGKTTTLYSFLKKINVPGVKIITIEDPIEYHIEGISQSQTDSESGYTFASGLRSILRQDPDVILVGEIRDNETADISLHAALTGHLVFSTLHTNDAPSSLLRLVDMGLNPHIIAPALNIVIAQRLVRMLCSSCSKKEQATEEDLKLIKDSLSNLPENIKKPDLEDGIEIAKPIGCKLCNNTGYKGRIGLFEMFKITPEVETLMTSNPTHKALIELAKKNGMIQINQDGFLKVLAGKTTIEEVQRIAL